MLPLRIKRTQCRLSRDPRRVLAKPYLPGEEAILPGESRASLLLTRVLAIPEDQVRALNIELQRRFAHRHRDLHTIWARHYDAVAHWLPADQEVSADRRQLIGAYFTHEYSVEAAALFNPSIVPAPDQSGLPIGAKRFIMSLRAVGEGHLSSIEFRSGVLGANGEIGIDNAGTHLVAGRRTLPAQFDKFHFTAKLEELGAINELSSALLSRLPPKFTPEELEASLRSGESAGPPAVWFETAQIIRVLASSITGLIGRMWKWGLKTHGADRY